MRKIITHIIYLLFLTAVPAMGQVVEGVVLDTTDSTAIEHVFVRIEGCDGPFALTDKNGHFRLDSISWKSNFRLSFSHVSFKPLHAALQKTNGSYYMEPRNETLKEVVVESNWIYRQDEAVVVDFSKMRIEQEKQLSDALRHVPGIIKDVKLKSKAIKNLIFLLLYG